MSEPQAGGNRLQALPDFTVLILHRTTHEPVGTGIVVSTDGKILTCFHVVEEAGVNPRTGRPIIGWLRMTLQAIGARLARVPPSSAGRDGELGVQFIRVRDGRRRRRARVAACFPAHDDDVVLLELTDGPASLNQDQVAVLGAAGPSPGNPFQTFGFRRRGPYECLPGEGTIVDYVPLTQGKKLHAEPLMLRSQHIDSGMSGAAVLDRQRNLVVGLIAATIDLSRHPPDRDTAFAVDAQVLAQHPFQIRLEAGPFPRGDGPRPREAFREMGAAACSPLPEALHAPPSLPAEWIERAAILRELDADWDQGLLRVAGLIGFGGEGKSSLGVRWLRRLREDPGRIQPDGVFWWGFYAQPSVEVFFAEALTYLSGGRIDASRLVSANTRAQVLAAMLGAGRFLFVLDGLETLQHTQGDESGSLRSLALREFLEMFAGSDHLSFCLVTSRLPLIDLAHYTTYAPRDLGGLSLDEGRALLRRFQVALPETEMDQVVHDLGGHALSLSLVGAHLTAGHGDVPAHLGWLSSAPADERHDERVCRILARYDSYLSEAERGLLQVLSTFRGPVDEATLPEVLGAGDLGAAAGNTVTRLQETLGRLARLRILSHQPQARRLTLHPLVRDYYYATSKGRRRQAVHARLQVYYSTLTHSRPLPQAPTLADFTPAIEAVYHACRAGAYEEALATLVTDLYQGESYWFAHHLGAYETLLAMLRGFFPDGNPARDPLLERPGHRRLILNNFGTCLESLGQMREALPFLRRAIALAEVERDWFQVSRNWENLAGAHILLGELEAASDAARKAYRCGVEGSRVDPSKGTDNQCYGLALEAWVAHLLGQGEAAGALFRRAERLMQEMGPTHLIMLYGVHHTDYLRRAGELSYARDVARTNEDFCRRGQLTPFLGLCLRALGDLDAAAGRHEDAVTHYAEAVALARTTSRRDFLIDVLLARGRWLARQGDAEAAHADLEESYHPVIWGGFRLYEADLYVGQALVHAHRGDPAAAHRTAERALYLSGELGYHWGKVDAEEVLSSLDGAPPRGP